MKARALLVILLAALLAGACRVVTFVPRVLGKTIALGFQDIRPVKKLEHPARPGASLAVSWVGHATMLVQLEDKFILTDPVFTDTVGQISKRLVEPGILPKDLPPIDVVLISHLHFDHLSLGSLELIEDKVQNLIVPQRGLVYVPEAFPFRTWELARWERWEQGGVRITAVPVRHVGFRYGLDGAWMTTSYTGYVIEYRGRSVYFGGDTGYGRGFRETAERFPHLDLALLPIAPIEPRDFMCRVHLDPNDAVLAFLDLKARYLVPMHFDTFLNSDDEFGAAPRELRRVVKARHLEDRLVLLAAGEQRVLE